MSFLLSGDQFGEHRVYFDTFALMAQLGNATALLYPATYTVHVQLPDGNSFILPSVSLSGNSLVLNFTPAPEPAQALLLCAAAAVATAAVHRGRPKGTRLKSGPPERPVPSENTE